MSRSRPHHVIGICEVGAATALAFPAVAKGAGLIDDASGVDEHRTSHGEEIGCRDRRGIHRRCGRLLRGSFRRNLRAGAVQEGECRQQPEGTFDGCEYSIAHDFALAFYFTFGSFFDSAFGLVKNGASPRFIISMNSCIFQSRLSGFFTVWSR